MGAFASARPAEPSRSMLSGSLPCGRSFIAILEALRATGGAAPADIVGPLLDERGGGERISLSRLLRSGRVFGFEWCDSVWIPMFQFDAADLTLKPGPLQVRAELPSFWPGWTLASWFAAPNEWLDGLGPVDLLDSDLDAAVQAARFSKSIGGDLPFSAAAP
jgi:hypothetical protein